MALPPRKPLCSMVAMALAVSLTSAPAAAAVVIVPVAPLMPYAPFAPYYEVREPYLQVDNEYFDLSLSGLQSLCRGRPELCAAPLQQDELQSLRGRRIGGIVLLTAGLAGLIGGTIWSLSTIREDDLGFVRSANYVPLYVGLGVGVALPLAGGIIMPHSGDIIDFVNVANRAHPDEPVRIHLSGGPRGTKGLALSLKF